MKRRILYLGAALALVLALTVSSTAIAAPSDIRLKKEYTDLMDVKIVYVGDIIYFALLVENPADNTATNNLTRIWDTMPDGTTEIELLGPGESLVQAPGDLKTYYVDYTVDEADVVWIPWAGYWGVINTLEAEGIDDVPDRVYGQVEKHARVIRPDTKVTIGASATTVTAGQPVTLTITEKNTGHDPLTDVYVEIYKDGALFATLDPTHPSWSCDGNQDTVLDPANWAESGDPAETWTWTISSGPITGTTTFVALGFGFDPLDNEVSFREGYEGERDEVTISTDPSVGGEGFAGNKAAILARWIALAGLLVGGVAILRRRSAAEMG